jgi:hypothetical protein
MPMRESTEKGKAVTGAQTGRTSVHTGNRVWENDEESV